MAKAAKKPPTKTEILNNIAKNTDLPRKKVNEVIEALTGEIRKSLGPRGPGSFSLPGLIKIEKRKVPAKPARKNVVIAGVPRDVPAKPATTKIRVRPLKNLKEMVQK